MARAFEYIQSDFYRYRGFKPSRLKATMYLLTGRNHCYNYSFWFRLATRAHCKATVIVAKVLMHMIGSRHGLIIPPSVEIGYGLYIGHGIGIVMNGRTRIGNNVNISHFLTIGSNHGKPAVIGDRVYIGPGVSLVEDVTIGDDAVIGAGTIVIHDVPTGHTSVGNPNRSFPSHERTAYIGNPWPM